MRNYNTYIKGMQKGQNEKLFFLQQLDLNTYDTIIDFGCGNADILKCLSHICSAKLIGIDNDPIMIEFAKRNATTAVFYRELTKDMLNDKTLIIFSSVLHEIEDYWFILKKIIKGSGATIVIRDMYFNNCCNRLLTNEELSKIVKNSHAKYLSEFINKYGMKTIKHAYHYFLKYSYIDNWDLELKENYFSFNYKQIKSLGTILYEKTYTLEFKHNKVLNDFEINMNLPTHIFLIIKLKKY